MAFSRTGKSSNKATGPGKFWKFEFFRGLKISGKIFSRRYELSRDSRESILGVVVCKFILLVFPGGDSLLFLFSIFYSIYLHSFVFQIQFLMIPCSFVF